LSGEGNGPAEWDIAWLCESWNALPFEGGVLEQPLGLLVMVGALREYDRAYAIYERDPAHAPAAVRDLVLLTAKASAEMRMKANG
jgi:hypothetical protein